MKWIWELHENAFKHLCQLWKNKDRNNSFYTFWGLKMLHKKKQLHTHLKAVTFFAFILNVFHMLGKFYTPTVTDKYVVCPWRWEGPSFGGPQWADSKVFDADQISVLKPQRQPSCPSFHPSVTGQDSLAWLWKIIQKPNRALLDPLIDPTDSNQPNQCLAPNLYN